MFNHPLFGLQLAQAQEADVYGCVTALCRAAASVRESVAGFIDYLPVVHSPVSIMELVEGSETAETTAWRRREKSTGYVSGDCPIEVYIMTRPPVYSESGDKKFYCFLRKALVAADGRWDAIGPEVRSEIFDTCEHT